MIYFETLGKAFAVKGSKRTEKTAKQLVELILQAQGYRDIAHAKEDLEDFESRYQKSIDRLKKESTVGEIDYFTDNEGVFRYNFTYNTGRKCNKFVNQLYLES